MSSKRISCYILKWLILLPTMLHAQESSVTGCVVDSSNQASLESVTIVLINESNINDRYTVATNEYGCFQFQKIPRTSYILKISRIGYREYKRSIEIRQEVEDLGTIELVQSPVQMKSIDVIAQTPPVEQHDDTVQFNAEAFRTNPDATIEDLVKKLPGVTVDNKTVKAQGEEIKQVFVDGRQFFGADPMIALRNLPADIVDKIQVYNKLSDQAELTKFDDGQSIKTMNVVTKEDRRHRHFGKISGGYGNDKYLANGMFNIFNGDERYSIIASSNNINQQDFTTQDMLGAMNEGGGRRKSPGGGPAGEPGEKTNTIGQQNGINIVHTFGINYSNQLANNLYATGNYFGNIVKNNNDMEVYRQYEIGSNENQSYHEKSNSNNYNYNHRLQMRMEYDIDSLNAIIVDPRLSVQSNDASNVSFTNMNYHDGNPFYDTQTKSSTNSEGYNLDASAVYRHRFNIQGRTLAANISYNANQTQSDGLTQSITRYYNTEIIYDPLNQKTVSLSPGHTIGSGIVYTEPFGERNLLQLNYNTSITKNSSDKKVYDYDSSDREYSILRNELSNDYNSEYIRHQVGIGYRGKTKKINFIANISFQRAYLDGIYKLPVSYAIRRDYSNVLPMVLIMYRLSSYNSFHLMYRTYTAAPPISQLQSVIDSSKTTMLTMGDPGLPQSYSHEVMMHYAFSNVVSGSSFFIMLNARTTSHYIASATYLFPHDTTLSNGISLLKGTQLTKPVSMNGYYNVNAICFYGIPIDWIRFNLNVSTGFSYSRTPAVVNDIVNYSHVYGLNQGIVLASNISEDIDFTLMYNYTLTYSQNIEESTLNTHYYQHSANAGININVWNGIILRSDLSHQSYNAEGTSQDRHYLLWNLGIAKKILKNESLEIALNAYDVLHQNQSVSHTIASTYIEDVQSKILASYIMLTISYTICPGIS